MGGVMRTSQSIMQREMATIFVTASAATPTTSSTAFASPIGPSLAPLSISFRRAYHNHAPGWQQQHGGDWRGGAHASSGGGGVYRSTFPGDGRGEFHATTILCVRKEGKVVLIGDGQVSTAGSMGCDGL